MKKLIINGHPNPESFCRVLAQEAHLAAAGAGTEVEILHLSSLSFDLNLYNGYRTVLEPDLRKAQQLILWSDHIVFVYPTWWWSMPALLKGFIDRVFLPKFAFEYKGKSLPDKLLKGKTATLVVTMDGPAWYFKWFMGNVGHILMRRGVLAFCGIHTTKTWTIDNMHTQTDIQRRKWLTKMQEYIRGLG